MAKAKPEPTKRPSISDVAKTAGVSPSAVSKVLRDAYGVSPLMRAKVEDAIKKLGYRPRTGARAMRGQSHVIGVSIPQLGNEFFTQIINGIQDRLQQTGYTVLIAPPVDGRQCREALNALVDHQVDGIISIAPDVGPTELGELARHTPMVMIGRHDMSSEYDNVVGDDESGAMQVMKYLLASGHKNICLLTVLPDWDLPDARQPQTLRRYVYEREMLAAGLNPRVVFSNHATEEVYLAAKEILSREDRPTALVTGHDALAIEALRALHDLGLTVQDVSIVGYDDIDISSHPLVGLSTVRQYGELMGKKAVELLLERIEGLREATNQLSISPKFIERSSSQALTN